MVGSDTPGDDDDLDAETPLLCDYLDSFLHKYIFLVSVEREVKLVLCLRTLRFTSIDDVIVFKMFATFGKLHQISFLCSIATSQIRNFRIGPTFGQNLPNKYDNSGTFEISSGTVWLAVYYFFPLVPIWPN